MNDELGRQKHLTDDWLDELRDLLSRQREHLEEHGVLYDAPGPAIEDLEWVIGEVERLRSERDEARKIVLDLWSQASRMVYENLGKKYSWVPDTRGGPVVTEPDDMPLVRTDLNWPDDHGRPQALIPLTEFDPARIHPGATAKVGTEDAFYRLRILSTELNTAPDGSQRKVHVTFEQPEDWRRDDDLPLETAPIAAERDDKLAVVRGVPCEFGPDGARYYPETVAVRLDALLEEMLAGPGDLTIRHWETR